MTRAEFKGFYTNHSLRATTANRLFRNEISDQLTMQQTGHRSNAVFSYKRESDAQKQEVSSILQCSSSKKVCTDQATYIAVKCSDKEPVAIISPQCMNCAGGSAPKFNISASHMIVKCRSAHVTVKYVEFSCRYAEICTSPVVAC